MLLEKLAKFYAEILDSTNRFLRDLPDRTYLSFLLVLLQGWQESFQARAKMTEDAMMKRRRWYETAQEAGEMVAKWAIALCCVVVMIVSIILAIYLIPAAKSARNSFDRSAEYYGGEGFEKTKAVIEKADRVLSDLSEASGQLKTEIPETVRELKAVLVTLNNGSDRALGETSKAIAELRNQVKRNGDEAARQIRQNGDALLVTQGKFQSSVDEATATIKQGRVVLETTNAGLSEALKSTNELIIKLHPSAENLELMTKDGTVVSANFAKMSTDTAVFWHNTVNPDKPRTLWGKVKQTFWRVVRTFEGLGGTYLLIERIAGR